MLVIENICPSLPIPSCGSYAATPTSMKIPLRFPRFFPFTETEATNFECRQHPTAQLDQLLKTRRQLRIFSEPPCLSCFVNFAFFILFGSCFGLRLTRGKVSGCRWLPVHKTELRRTNSRYSTRHRKSKAAKCSKVGNNIKNIQEPAKVSTERHN